MTVGNSIIPPSGINPIPFSYTPRTDFGDAKGKELIELRRTEVKKKEMARKMNEVVNKAAAQNFIDYFGLQKANFKMNDNAKRNIERIVEKIANDGCVYVPTQPRKRNDSPVQIIVRSEKIKKAIESYVKVFDKFGYQNYSTIAPYYETIQNTYGTTGRISVVVDPKHWALKKRR